MIIDSERNLVAIKEEYIFLTPYQNLLLTLIIESGENGIYKKRLKQLIRPYTMHIANVIIEINKKISRFGEIYSECGKYKIFLYQRYINKKEYIDEPGR